MSINWPPAAQRPLGQVERYSGVEGQACEKAGLRGKADGDKGRPAIFNDFPAQANDGPTAGNTESIDYSRGVLQISVVFPSQVIDVPIAGDTKSIDYSRDVLQISMIIPSQRISKVLIAAGTSCKLGCMCLRVPTVGRACPHWARYGNANPEAPFLLKCSAIRATCWVETETQKLRSYCNFLVEPRW